MALVPHEPTSRDEHDQSFDLLFTCSCLSKSAMFENDLLQYEH